MAESSKYSVNTFKVKYNGAWIKPTKVYIRSNGAWVPITFKYANK